MTLLVEKGTFTKTTSTSTPVSQQVNLVDSSLTPKVIWLWTAGQTTSNGTYTDHVLWSYGWSDTVNDVCQALRAHETNEQDCYIMRNDAIISIISLTAGSEVSKADISAVAAGSFTLNWSTQSDTTAMVIHYMVAGGTDITNVSAFTSTMQNTTTGNHSWNGTGTTFTPEFAMTTAMQDVNILAINTISNLGNNSELSLGVATSTTKQWLLIGREETSATSDTDTYLHNAQCLGSLNPTSGAFAYGGTFVSFNNSAGGGITINIQTAASNINPVGFLLIKGGKWDVGAFQQPAATGTQDVTLTDSTVVPKLVQLVGINSATGNALVANDYIGVGGSDGTREGNCYNGSTNALAAWVTARSTDTGKAYRNATPAATATSTTTNAECDVTGMSTAGQFTLDWTTADATQRQMAFWMIGAVPSGTNYTRTASDTVTLSESIASVQTNVRTPSTETITVTDASLTRSISRTVTPTADTTTIGESIVKLTTRPRTVSDTTTVSDASLTRLLSTRRTPSETTSISESSTRMLSATRIPSADTTTIGESIVRSKSHTETVTPDTVTIGESIVKLTSRPRALSDTVTVADSSLTRLLSATRVPASDTTTVTDASLTGIKTLTRIPTTDVTNISESSLTRLLSLTRVPSSDTVVLSESISRSRSRTVAPATDTVIVTDGSIVRSVSRLRTPSDTTAVTDGTLLRVLSATRVPSTETVTISDGSVTRMLSALRLPSVEVISLSENIVPTYTQGTTSITRSVSDTVAISESIARLVSVIRTASDATIVSDSLTRMLSLIRSPSETTAIGESLGVTLSGRISRSVSDTVPSTESLNRMLSAKRALSDTQNVNESVLRSKTVPKSLTDNVGISDAALTRTVGLSRSVTSDTTSIIESALVRLLSLNRNLSDTIPISELNSLVQHARSLVDTVTITEPVLTRIVTAVREVTDSTDISEAVFYQTFHKFVFDSVPISEQLFKERTQLSGSVTYATPDEVRPLLGNLGAQKPNEPIELAIDAAFDEINTKTNRIPPNEWKDTDHNFGIVKKLARYIAAKEVAIGIKDFDTKPFEMEIEHLFNDLLTYDTTSDATQDIVGSSEDTTYALSEGGIIWSTRYRNLRKNTSSENSTTINPNT